MFLPSEILKLFNSIKDQSVPIYSMVSEEERYTPPTFVEENQDEPIELSKDDNYLVNIDKPSRIIYFDSFLDGVQRTIAWKYISVPNGALVPIHLAHIGALAVLRRKDGQLYVDPRLQASRLLLLGPFEGLKKSGVNIVYPKLSNEVIVDTDNKTFAFPGNPNEWVICDTTYCGTDESRGQQSEDGLYGDRLFNEGSVRSRAQGRVATLRQRLEFAVLARLRRLYPNSWVLVDGPLFFIEKWRNRAARILSKELGEIKEELFEDRLLSNSVGLIKGQRLKPKRPEQILMISHNQRSLVIPLSYEVDMKGKRDLPDEHGRYAGMHFTWYTRLRGRKDPPYGMIGLIRLDIHRSTLPGLVRADACTREAFMEFCPLIDAITWAIWQERWPAFKRRDDMKTAAEPYPIWQLERICKSMLFPRRYLAYFSH